MAKRTLPGLGLTGFWPAGANDWGPENDANLLALSVMVGGSALSATTSLPGSPSNGDIYIVPTGDTNAEDVAIRDDGAWVYLTPSDGFRMWVSDTSEYLRFDGSSWVATSGVVPITRQTQTSNYVLTDSDLAGNVVKKIDIAGANTVTINSGLVGTEPLMVVQMGLGQTTFVAGAGVTIRSADGALKMRTRYSAASLIPDGTNAYILSGDITT